MDLENLISLTVALIGFAGSIGAVIITIRSSKNDKRNTQIDNMLKDIENIKAKHIILENENEKLSVQINRNYADMDNKLDRNEERFNRLEDKLDKMQENLNRLDYFFSLVTDLKHGLASFTESFTQLNNKYTKIEYVINQLETIYPNIKR